MTNFRDEDRLIETDLRQLYAADVPELRFDPSAANVPARLRWSWRFGRRPAVAAAVVVAAVAAVLVAPSLWSDDARQVSAAELFERASASAQSLVPANGTLSYHLVAVSEAAEALASTPDDPQPQSPVTTVTTTAEVWYVDVSHQRNEIDWNGDGVADFGVTVNGNDAWMYGDFGGVFRAVHGPASELGTSLGDQSPSASLGEVLGQYSGDCQDATLDGEETTAGRAAYRIVVTPDADACSSIDGERGKDIGKLGTLIMDVDKETFLPLKIEQQGDGGVPAYNYTVTQIQVGEDLADSIFTYVAPDGVTVQDVANVTEAKNDLAGYTAEGVAPTPVAP